MASYVARFSAIQYGMVGVPGNKDSDLGATGSIASPIATKPYVQANDDILAYPSPFH